MKMIILKYISTIVILYTNITLYLCTSELEDDLEYFDPMDSTTYSRLLRTEQTEELKFLVPDDKWLVNALQDIAYFLRNHKFNEWDRRFYTEKPKDNLMGFYIAFPDPSLRVIYWKVYENCHKDFYKCITYLYSVIEIAPFTRSDDITTTLNKNIIINKTSVNKLDNNCKKALLYTDKTGLPFDAPKEKFQWRTSASYYMCWYTMLGIPALSMLGESCDNFANCLDSKFGQKNHDPRSDDKLSFACAMYSFCPDPCCPLKHVKTLAQCHNSKSNPCFTENAGSTDLLHRQCHFDRKKNQNLEQLIANKWNVSCYCKEEGFEWQSQFGICVDINECTTNMHNCDSKTENCLNLPGKYQCICKWGFAYDVLTKRCVEKKILVKSNHKHKESRFSYLDSLKCFLNYIGF